MKTARRTREARPSNSSESSFWKGRRIRIHHALLVDRTPEDVYHYFRDFEILPPFCEWLGSVLVSSERLSHWACAFPNGLTFQWDMEIVDDQENRLIEWQTLPGSDIEHSGWISFQKVGGRECTKVGVDISYVRPEGKLGSAIEFFEVNSSNKARSILNQMKMILETGELPSSLEPLPSR